MAGGVVGHPVREECTEILDARDVDKKFGQVKGFCCRGTSAVDKRGIAVALCYELVLFADRSGAGAGGGDHVINGGVRESINVVADLGDRFTLVAGVDVHLSTAGLFWREDHVIAEP